MPTPSPLQIGDLVRLKSGGPIMVIGALTNDVNGTMAECYWHSPDATYITSYLVPLDTLVLEPTLGQE